MLEGNVHEAHHRFREFARSPYLPQICAGIIISLETILAFDNGALALILLPIAIGSLLPFFWWLPHPIHSVERWGSTFAFRRDRASLEPGSLATIRRNIWAGALRIWLLAKRIHPDSVRAGTRVLLLCYYFGAFAILIAFLAYLAFAILILVLVLMALGAAAWIWMKSVSPASPPGGSPRSDDTPRAPIKQPVIPVRHKQGTKARESWVDKKHVRLTSSDGNKSFLYKVDGFGSRTCVEIADHHSDGTTDAYEVGGVVDSLFGDGKGAKK